MSAETALSSSAAIDTAITEVDFKFLCDFLVGHSGLYLTKDKNYLAQTRLPAVCKTHGFPSITQLITSLKTSNNPILKVDVAEAMATPETFFFRDTKPFDQFKNIVLPPLLENLKTQKKLRIWSCACSSGQEPYSIAMILTEMGLYAQGWNIEIMATDFSSSILNKARQGDYTQFEVQRGLPIQYLIKYFEKNGTTYTIKKDLKARIHFKPFNLLSPFTGIGKFDVIFCRNVLFYFDVVAKRKILDHGLATAMNPEGSLFLGSAETVMGVSDKLVPMEGERGIYKLKP